MGGVEGGGRNVVCTWASKSFFSDSICAAMVAAGDVAVLSESWLRYGGARGCREVEERRFVAECDRRFKVGAVET
jgi:hypothetical protein